MQARLMNTPESCQEFEGVIRKMIVHLIDHRADESEWVNLPARDLAEVWREWINTKIREYVEQAKPYLCDEYDEEYLASIMQREADAVLSEWLANA